MGQASMRKWVRRALKATNHQTYADWRPRTVRRSALKMRKEHRAQRRREQALRNGQRWNFQNVRMMVGGVEVRGLKALNYELADGNEQMKTWAKEAGLPSPWPDEKLRALQERVKSADHYGPLHVVLDDVSLEDEYLRQAILSAEQGEHWSDAQLGRDLLALSLDDRARVFGYLDWATYEADGSAAREGLVVR